MIIQLKFIFCLKCNINSNPDLDSADKGTFKYLFMAIEFIK